MSDPMTNAEVEDVLSSIRRLVSENKPPKSEEVEETKPDRLVLTPALRVGEEEHAEEPAEEVLSHSAPVGTPDEPPQDALETLNTFIRSEAARQAREVALSEGLRSTDDTDEGGDVEEAAQTPADNAIEASGETAEDASLFAETDENTAAPEPEGGVISAEAEANDFAINLNFVHDAPVAVEPAEVASDPAPEPEPKFEFEPETDTAPEPEAAHETVVDADPQDTEEPSSLGDKVAALETLIQRRQDRWEPDDTGADEYAGTDAPTMTWEDATPDLVELTAAEPDAPEDDLQNGDVNGDAHQDDAVTFDEAELDEETLREIVSDIVREELQGALGERITRNVRKLVRREIHRVLASRDFE